MIVVPPTQSGKQNTVRNVNVRRSAASSPARSLTYSRSSTRATAYRGTTATSISMSPRREARLNNPRSVEPQYNPSITRGIWLQLQVKKRDSMVGAANCANSRKCRPENPMPNLRGTVYQSMIEATSLVMMACQTNAQTPAPPRVRTNPTIPPTNKLEMERSARGWNCMSRFVAAVGAAAKALIAGRTDIQRNMEASSGSPNQRAIRPEPAKTPIPMASDKSTLAAVMV